KTSAESRARTQCAFVVRATAAPASRWLGSASNSSSSVPPRLSNLGATAGYSFLVSSMRSFRLSGVQNEENARGIRAASRPQRAVLRQPSGREGGRGAELRRRTVGTWAAAELVAGTDAAR